ncbi:hypothetical protein Sfum_4021 [Syntrophobacter fumaroxidans MPOB]|uniref:Uncharacterized protein n=1 Tax=Syntrophobacter fumaroxidans (strain DSM 10017 / MPOB) TaxID=335543 RepID=A0LQI5_SYNFM|nr:hypothetical protein Sfum_4021 [Syntrophobacter fumaroxidans MPOB]
MFPGGKAGWNAASADSSVERASAKCAKLTPDGQNLSPPEPPRSVGCRTGSKGNPRGRAVTHFVMFAAGIEPIRRVTILRIMKNIKQRPMKASVRFSHRASRKD